MASTAAQNSGLIPAHAGKTRSPSQTPRTPRAHPRSRGENKHYTRGQFTITGSSPLTRGKHLLLEGAHVVYGLIPAHAGKTSEAVVSITHLPAHPRSRGENIAEQGWDAYALGSSPLTRGKRVRISAERIIRRLIPAHAGKTSASSWAPSAATAHPRSRGENVEAHGQCSDLGGSSPLTRGKRGRTGGLSLAGRLIPAHAGKTP